MSTKIHALCDALGNPTGFYLSEGQAHDLEGADAPIRLSRRQIATRLLDVGPLGSE